MDRSHGFQILKPWRMQLFIRPDIRRNLTDEKKTYTQPTHTHEIEKKKIFRKRMRNETRR
jgi:hypothetical protein